MPQKVRVSVYARDPVSRAGVLAELRPRPEVEVVEHELDAEVAIVVADRLDAECERIIRAVRRTSAARVVAVIADLEGAAVLATVEAGASGLIRRDEADAERLVRVSRLLHAATDRSRRTRRADCSISSAVCRTTYSCRAA